jgi:hypothetical protein
MLSKVWLLMDQMGAICLFTLRYRFLMLIATSTLQMHSSLCVIVNVKVNV